jgi:hypothetical protein
MHKTVQCSAGLSHPPAPRDQQGHYLRHWSSLNCEHSGECYSVVFLACDYKFTSHYTTPILYATSIVRVGIKSQPLTRWRSWLRRCTTNRKVAGSIHDGVIGIFHWHNPSGCTMTLGSTPPPTEITTRNISGGGGGVDCLKSESLNLLEP